MPKAKRVHWTQTSKGKAYFKAKKDARNTPPVNTYGLVQGSPNPVAVPPIEPSQVRSFLRQLGVTEVVLKF